MPPSFLLLSPPISLDAAESIISIFHIESCYVYIYKTRPSYYDHRMVGGISSLFLFHAMSQLQCFQPWMLMISFCFSTSCFVYSNGLEVDMEEEEEEEKKTGGRHVFTSLLESFKNSECPVCVCVCVYSLSLFLLIVKKIKSSSSSPLSLGFGRKRRRKILMATTPRSRVTPKRGRISLLLSSFTHSSLLLLLFPFVSSPTAISGKEEEMLSLSLSYWG